MWILVDHANLSRVDKKRGVSYLVDRVLSVLGVSALSATRRCYFRLYGGWFDRSKLTRLAQDLAVDIQREYPKLTTVVWKVRMLSLTVSVELAYTLAAEPARRLLHTYRLRGVPEGLHCRHPSSAGCLKATCPLVPVYEFIERGCCPEIGCRIGPADLIYRGEQKLVDTMLAADVIYYAWTGEPEVCVVTSDDDLWPGMRTAMALGARILHVHTRPARSTPSAYCTGLESSYAQYAM